MICFSARHCLSPASGSKVAAVTGEVATDAGTGGRAEPAASAGGGEEICMPNANRNRPLRDAATGSTGGCEG